MTDDDPPASHPLSGETLSTQLDAAGISWAGYDEAYDGSGNTVPGGIGTSPSDGGPVVLVVLSAVLAGAAANTLGLGGDRNLDSPLTHAGRLGSIETYFGLAKLRDAANSTYGNLSPLLLASAAAAGQPAEPG